MKRAWLALRLWRAGGQPAPVASHNGAAPSWSPSLDVGALSDEEVSALLAELLNGAPPSAGVPPDRDGDSDIDTNQLSDDEVTAMLEQLLAHGGGAS